ncbi:MAG: hypothetical protein Q8P67_00195, partial [archaeon]|nr:hypothetical protein [archaeon]
MAASKSSTVDRPPPKLESGERETFLVKDVQCLTSPKPLFGTLHVTNFRLIYRFNPEKTKMYSGEQEVDDVSIPHM